MNKLLLGGVVLFQFGTLVGCAGGFGVPNMGNMSAEQIKAAVQDKSSAVACTDYTGTGGKFAVMLVNNDKTFNTGGGETTVKCGGGEVTFKDSGKAPAVPRVGVTTTEPTTTVTK